MRGDYGRAGKARPRRLGCAACAAPLPARFFLCGRCRTQVLICSHCDRGHVYCADSCAREARRRSLREAGRRYQASRRGRLKHATRSRRYRLRTNNVTHQGSPADRTDDLLPQTAVAAEEPTERPRPPRWHCHRCGRRCPELVRSDFLRRPWNLRGGFRRDRPP
jgi:hypothetical protein